MAMTTNQAEPGARLRRAAIAGLLWVLTITASAGQAVVLAHGKRDIPPYALDPLAQALRASGYTVVTPEMPWSARRNFDADHAQALAILVDAVTKLRADGATAVFVGGHGLGGNTALAAATRVPVDGVVLIAPAHAPDATAFAARVSDSVRQARDLVARGDGAKAVGLLDFDHRATHEIRITAAQYLSYFSPDGTAAMSLSAARLAPSVPVLWIYGTWDVLRDDGLDLFFSRLPPNAKHRRVALVNLMGNTPKAAVAEVVDWLSGLAHAR